MSAPRPGAQPLNEDDAGSSALLQLVFDHAGEGISVFDTQLRLTAWNERFLASTGLQAHQVYRGAPLRVLLLDMARAGEFGPCPSEAWASACADSYLQQLADGRAKVTERVRPDGRTIELRHNPTPGGGFVILYADTTERKATQAAEAALAREQRMLALILQRTEQGFWFIDNQQCTTDANPAMCRMLGLPRDQLLGQSIFNFVDEANAAIFRDRVRQRSLGQTGSYTITLRRADGSPVHCYNNATPIVDAAGEKVGALGLFSDISALAEAERQLRHTSALLAQKSHVLEVTLESLSQGVLSIDAQGHINTWNRRLLDLLRVPESFMATRPTFDELLQYQLEHGLLDGAPTLGLSRPVPFQRTRADGTVLEIQMRVADDGSVVRTYTDVTAQVHAERALRESETRFRTMADAAPALIWQSDAEGRGVWFNQRWLQLTGLTMADEVARHWHQRLHPEDRPQAYALFLEAAAARRSYSVEFRLLCGDGAQRWIADNGIPRYTAEGGFEGFIAYGWDITERKASEAALRAAKEEAERANRAKSEFLSRMSHELRTPLNAVLGFGQLMAQDRSEALGPAQRARLEELLRGGHHLLSLINEVLDLARIEAGTLQLALAPVNVAEVAQDALRMVQPMAAAQGISLQLQAGTALGASHVRADHTRLKQVLLNLLSNAIKYNRQRGTVQLGWRHEASDRAVYIDVVDTGPGLSTVQQEKLFQAFERLDAERSSVEGAGIGLALSKWLVDLMHGDIGVRSTLGQGSTFWLRLQACEADAAAEPEAALPVVDAGGHVPAAAAPAVARRTVLYIEDNPVNQLLMEGMLAQRPHLRLLIASLPAVGLTMAAEVEPDLVLLDIQLPGMDGFEVLRRLRAAPATRHTPVVAVSANAMPGDLAAARAAGFADYVTKPLDLQRLLHVVDGLLQP